MLVLGIETSCDETSCAIVRDGHEILSHVVTSQIDLHKEFGGVVPELACRRHVETVLPVVEAALKNGGLELEQIDLIAVAQGPGLAGALLIGINAAKTLAWVAQKPLIGVNHIEAHLYAALMTLEKPPLFPCLGAVLSGGHTSLVLIEEIGRYKLLGQTVDDAIGEAYDKVAKILGLSYPGGPEVEKLALEGDPNTYNFKAGNVKGRPFDFSFSGLKTAVLYAARGPKSHPQMNSYIDPLVKPHLAASFQEAALKDVAKKIGAAADAYHCQTVVFGGGVCSNQRLRSLFQNDSKHTYVWPPKEMCVDNAAMIAGLGYHRYKTAQAGDFLTMEAATTMPFSCSMG